MDCQTTVPRSDSVARERPFEYGWLLVALGVALGLQSFVVARSPLIAPDGIGFIQFAQQLAIAPGAALESHAQHPGYPALVLAAHAFCGQSISSEAGWIAAARISSGLSGLACVPLVWLIGRQVLGLQVANVGAVLFALLPTVRQNAADALSDSTHLMLLLSALWLAARAAMRPRWWQFLLGGAFCGLAYLVRPEGLAVTAAAAGCALVVPAWRICLGWRRALGAAAALLLGSALVVAPYVATVGTLTGKLAGKPGWQRLKRDVDASNNEPAVTPPAASATTGMAPPFGSPAAACGTLAVNLAETLHGVLLAPLLLGIPRATRRMHTVHASLLWALALILVGQLLLLYVLGGYMDRRHLIPLLAVLIPSLSEGTLALGCWLKDLASRRSRTAWLLPTATACGLVVLVPRTVRPLHESHLHKLAAAEWINRLCQAGDTVGSNAVHVAYYTSLAGRARCGTILGEWQLLDGERLRADNRFFVLELDEHNEIPDCLSHVPQWFSCVATVRGDPLRRQRQLVIYERAPDVQAASRMSTDIQR
jgi:hypothetical protein